jgi:arylsulfatase A-like enzyme
VLPRWLQLLRERIDSLDRKLAGPLQGHYASALAATLVVLCAVETAVVRGMLTVAYAVHVSCLAIGLGTLAGLAWQLLVVLLARALGRFAWLPWPVAMVGGGFWLADRLGAFARLASRYDDLARLTIGGCALGGLALGVLLAVMQPTRRAPRGRLARGRVALRMASALVLACGCGALSYADHTLYVGLYPEAHLALRSAAACVAMLALVAIAPELRLPRHSIWGLLLALLLLGVPVATLYERHSDTVQAFVIRPWPATLLRSARMIFDLDRDGYSWALGGGDCSDWNPRVHPSAREIPDNGIDDNCMFGDRSARAAASADAPIPGVDSPMNVVLITIDCLRYDRVGIFNKKYGPKGRDTMPEVSKWATHAVRFSRAYAPGAWTSVSVGAMLRGVYARRLRWIAYYETNFFRMLRKPFESQLFRGEAMAKMFPLSFQDERRPLAEWLQRRGMRTLAVVDDGFSQMLASSLGASRGFDVYNEINAEPTREKEMMRERRRQARRAGRDDAATATTAISTLRMSTEGKKFFMWVHFFGPHTPDTLHAGVKTYGPGLEDGYDHEVRYTDGQVKRVLDAIEELPDATAVFITADHGEFFFSGYRSHGNDLAESVIHVPLLARVPGWKPGKVSSVVSLVDLMPTMLALTQTPAPRGLDGVDLARVVAGRPPQDRIFFSDVWQYSRQGVVFNDLVSAFDGRRKVVWSRRDHSFSVHDQTDFKARPVRIEGLAPDRLTRSILGYVDEAGGQLDLRD